MTVDVQAAAAAVMNGLVGPGGPFELVNEQVLGTELPVFAHRRRALHELLAESAAFGERTYVATHDRSITFAENVAAVSSLAQGLREDYGLRPGDRVAINAANTPEWITAFWATVSIGAIAVAFNAWWSPREVEYGLEHSDPKLIIADARRLSALVGTSTPVLSIEEDIPALSLSYPDAPLPSADVAEDDPAAIIYT